MPRILTACGMTFADIYYESSSTTLLARVENGAKFTMLADLLTPADCSC